MLCSSIRTIFRNKKAAFLIDTIVSMPKRSRFDFLPPVPAFGMSLLTLADIPGVFEPMFG